MAWLNENWDYRVKVTVAAAQVSSDLTDFPVFVNLANLPAGFHTNVNQTDARDIRVTLADETTEVPRQVVSYDSATDTGELHFKGVGTISSTTDTDFYIYYGNSAATEPAADATYGSQAVWKRAGGDYIAVYHMEDASDDLTDSTENEHHAAAVGTPTYGVDGKLGKAVRLDGLSDRFQATFDDVAPHFPLTLSGWGKTAETDAQIMLLSYQGSNRGHGLHLNNGNVSGWARSDSTFGNQGGESYTANQWFMGHWVASSNASRTIYTDGGDPSSSTLERDFTTNWNRIFIGSWSSSQQFDGDLDSLRIAMFAASAEWIAAEYTNQNTPTTFYTVGSQEDQPVASSFIPKIIMFS